MPLVLIYTRALCSYCLWAKDLLYRKGIAFQEIDVTSNPDLREEMIRRAEGRATTPQILIGTMPIGGCDELYALERTGRLDAMLAGPAGEH